MISKSLFLVLLGAAFVLSGPIPEINNQELTVSTDTKVENLVADEKEHNTLNFDAELDLLDDNDDADDDIPDLTTVAPVHKSTWSKIKSSLKKFFSEENMSRLKQKSKEKYKNVKSKLLKLKNDSIKYLKEAQKMFEEIRTEGKEVYKEIHDAFKTVKETWAELKKSGVETYEDLKKGVEELKKAVKAGKEKLNKLKIKGTVDN